MSVTLLVSSLETSSFASCSQPSNMEDMLAAFEAFNPERSREAKTAQPLNMRAAEPPSATATPERTTPLAGSSLAHPLSGHVEPARSNSP